MQYSYNEKIFILGYIIIYQNDKILNSFFTELAFLGYHVSVFIIKHPCKTKL